MRLLLTPIVTLICTAQPTSDAPTINMTLLAPFIPPDVRARLVQIAAAALSRYPDEVLELENDPTRRLQDTPRVRKRDIARKVVEKLIDELVF